MMKQLTVKKRNKIIDILAVVFIAIVFLCWSYRITPELGNILAGPDEGMRYIIPQFIFENHRLPTGYETEIHGNWSYAFYPQVLGAIISAGFMHVTSLFSDDAFSLVRAARLTSLMFGVIAAIFIRRSMRLLFDKSPHKATIGNVAMVVFALLPQVSFLSAYVNNDIIALAGVSIIVYACLHTYKKRVNLAGAAYFAAGTVIAVLGYQNSYGFVLAGFLYLLWELISYYKQTKNRRFIVQFLLIALGIPALLCLPFLIRNMVLYHGDIFGIKTFRSEYVRWVHDTGIVLQNPYQHGLNTLLFHTRWVMDTLRSFILGHFGGWNKGIATIQYWPYYIMGLIAIAGFVTHFKLTKENHRKYALIASLVLGALITIVLSLYYTLNIDYQPQGRYIIYLAIPVVLMVSAGIVYLVQRVVKPRYVGWVLVTIAGLYVSLHLSVVYQTLF